MQDNNTSENIKKIQEALLSWFFENQRKFPWRDTSNPFHIMIAEKLLQQTAAGNRVILAYDTLVNQFPNPSDIAEADIGELRVIFQPLGFHYRASEIIELAKHLSINFSDQVPASLDELKSLPGIGEYIARAVLSFAYGVDISIVDTNIARFLYRLFGISGKFPSNPARKSSLLITAQNLLPEGKSREFNFAILDLCALICLPKMPKCIICPVQKYCYYGVNYNN